MTINTDKTLNIIWAIYTMLSPFGITMTLSMRMIFNALWKCARKVNLKVDRKETAI